MALRSFLNKHLEEADETYVQHMAFTLRCSAMLILAGLAVFIHGLTPFLFTHTGSRLIDRLNADLQTRRKACEESRKKKN